MLIQTLFVSFFYWDWRGIDFQLVEDGIVLVQQHDGRASGEGFVQLESMHNIEDALKLNNGHIGHRLVRRVVYQSIHYTLVGIVLG